MSDTEEGDEVGSLTSAIFEEVKDDEDNESQGINKNNSESESEDDEGNEEDEDNEENEGNEEDGEEEEGRREIVNINEKIVDDAKLTKMRHEFNGKLRIVKPEDRQTSSYITKFELASVIGIRAQHIDSGAPPFVEFADLVKIEDIALREIYQKKCPLSVIRRVGNKYEIWSVNEMVLPQGFKNNNPI